MGAVEDVIVRVRVEREGFSCHEFDRTDGLVACPSGITLNVSAAASGITRRRDQIRRRSLAQAVSWWRLDSCSLRSTAETWVSIVFTDRCNRVAISL
jgi:hypothetical protein